jgi:hypothetical protein
MNDPRLLPERSWLREREELAARKRQASRTPEPGKHLPTRAVWRAEQAALKPNLYEED